MKVSATPNVIIIQENPGCIWLFGLFFAFIGGIFVYGSLGGFYNYRFQAPWSLALAFFMGAGAIGVGFWIIRSAPVTKVFINRLEEKVTVNRWGVFGKKTNEYAFDKIERFLLIEDRDDEGSPIWNFGMKLTDGEEIKITSLGKHAEDYEQQYVFMANQFTGKQLPIHELIFETEDESLGEIG